MKHLIGNVREFLICSPSKKVIIEENPLGTVQKREAVTWILRTVTNVRSPSVAGKTLI